MNTYYAIERLTVLKRRYKRGPKWVHDLKHNWVPPEYVQLIITRISHSCYCAPALFGEHDARMFLAALGSRYRLVPCKFELENGES